MIAPRARGRGARPNPIQWIGYTLGRRLPDSKREWVRNDLTGRHATTRHMIRGMVPFLPLFTAFLLLPGAVWLRGSTALLALLLALFYCAVYMPVNRSRRLTQHGLPADLENPAKRDQHRAERAIYESNHPRLVQLSAAGKSGTTSHR